MHEEKQNTAMKIVQGGNNSMTHGKARNMNTIISLTGYLQDTPQSSVGHLVRQKHDRIVALPNERSRWRSAIILARRDLQSLTSFKCVERRRT